ncbi:MAG: hypothetical protein WC730_03775 [Patescibacteria group bacterium]|jgi:hypothetical protein
MAQQDRTTIRRALILKAVQHLAYAERCLSPVRQEEATIANVKLLLAQSLDGLQDEDLNYLFETNVI